MDETLYGPVKRLRFFVDQIGQRKDAASPFKLIELGCGTGESLLLPLAESLGSAVELTGIDIDAQSIRHGQLQAQQKGLRNATFVHSPSGQVPASIPPNSWDGVVLSEVLEHVDQPSDLVMAAHLLLKPGGLLLVTVPNGYGPYEWEQFVWKGLKLEKGFQRLRALLGRGGEISPSTFNDANSHRCFFHWEDVNRLLADGGFDVVNVRNREMFCGPFSDVAMSLLKRVGLGRSLIKATQELGEAAPRELASDWMVAAVKSNRTPRAFTVAPVTDFTKWWWDVKRKQNQPRPIETPAAH